MPHPPRRPPAAPARSRRLPSAVRPARRQARGNSAPGRRADRAPTRALERRFGLGGDDAVLRAGQRFAEIGLALGGRRRAAAARSCAPSPRRRSGRAAYRPARAPPSRGHRPDFAPDAPRPVPTSSTIGLCSGGRVAPRRLRLARQIGRAEHEIEARRAERQQDQRRERGCPPPPAHAVRRRCRRDVVRRREQPPRDFDARGFRLALADQAGRAIALDLVELVAIDRDIAAGRAAACAAPSGHSTAKIAAAVISAKTNQSIMAEGYHPGQGQAKYNSRGRAGMPPRALK